MIRLIKNAARSYAASLTKKEKLLRIVTTVAGELFTLVVLIVLHARNDLAHEDMCITTFLVVLVPVAVEFILQCKLNTFIYLTGFLFAFTPMFGECFRMYYNTIWWDKFSHVAGGMFCAMFGFYIFRRLCGKDGKSLAAALFALFFSVTVAVAWEFVEYAGDCLFDMDTQNDVIVHDINSYMLPTESGVPGTIKDIKLVTLDGEELPFDGYLDIGLHDSMQDMLVETAGALIAMVIILVDGEKREPITTFGGARKEGREAA